MNPFGLLFDPVLKTPSNIPCDLMRGREKAAVNDLIFSLHAGKIPGCRVKHRRGSFSGLSWPQGSSQLQQGCPRAESHCFGFIYIRFESVTESIDMKMTLIPPLLNHKREVQLTLTLLNNISDLKLLHFQTFSTCYCAAEEEDKTRFSKNRTKDDSFMLTL